MPTHYSLETVIGLLDKHHQRATYGAFAALLERRQILKTMDELTTWLGTVG